MIPFPRCASLLILLAAAVPGLLDTAAVAAQEPSSVFAALSAGFAFVDVRPGDVLNGTGFQVSASLGRRLAPHVAGVAQLELTSVDHPIFAIASPPCASPGCLAAPAPNGATGLAFAPGIQLYRITPHEKLSFTAGPGVLWLFTRPSGTRAISPLFGAWVSWLIGSGPRLGVRLGAEAWLSDGDLPRWAVPATLSLELP